MKGHIVDQRESPIDGSVPISVVADAHRRRAFYHAAGQILQVFALSAIFGGAFVGWAWWQSGSANLVAPYLRGQRLLFEPAHVLVETSGAESVVERTVRIANLTSSDVTLLGAQESCGCITLDEFPITIPAGNDYQFKLKIGIPLEKGPFEQTVKIFSDYDGYDSFVLTISGTVL